MKCLGLAIVVVFCSYAVPAFAQQSAQRQPAVFLAATGAADQLPIVLDGISDCLSAKGVTVKQLSSSPTSRGISIDQVNEKGGTYLLFMSLDFVPSKNIRGSLGVHSLTATGKVLWHEEVTGGMLMITASSYVNGLVKKACKSLNKHIGQEGLPTDSAD